MGIAGTARIGAKRGIKSFLHLGGLLLTILHYSKTNIDQSHGKEEDAKDDGTPGRVAVVNEGDAIVDI